MFDFLGNLFNPSQSSFGVYTTDSLEKSLSGASNVRGSQFLLVQPDRARDKKTEASILNYHKTRMVVDTTIYRQEDRKRIGELFPNIQLLPFTGKRDNGRTRLQHSKQLLFDRGGRQVLRIDTAGFTGNNKFLDTYYETSNKSIVAEGLDYQSRLERNQTTDKAYRYLKIGDKALESVYSDLKKSKGDVYISTAGFNFRGAPTENKKTLSKIVDHLIDSDNNKIYINSPEMGGNVRQKLSEEKNISIGQDKYKRSHFNITLIENVDGDNIVYVGSRRYTSASNEEMLIRISQSEDANAYKFYKNLLKSNVVFQSHSSLANKQASKVIGKEATFSLPATLGPSYFYGISKYNVRQSLGGRDTVSYQDEEGMAAGAYRLSVYERDGTLLDSKDIPDYIRRLDNELTTPGLGAYVNQYFLKYGYDRIYKEEYGAIPSAMGLIGAILDKSIGYNTSSELDAYARRETFGARTRTPVEGPLQNLFTQASHFILQTAVAVGTYLSIGVPTTLLISKMGQVGLQKLLDLAVNDLQPDELDLKGPNKLKATTRKLAQLVTIGSSYTGISEVSQLHNDLNEQIALKSKSEDLASKNPGFATTFNYVFMRQRGSTLFDSLIRPFLVDIVNPYSPYIQADGKDARVNPKFTQLIKKIDNFYKVMSDPISIGKQITASGSTRYIYTNVGYSRQKAVAKAFDDLAAYLPINVTKWGWGDPKLNPAKGTFVSLGEVFSLSELIKTFENVVYGGDISRIAAQAERKDFSGSVKGTVLAKIQTVVSYPVTAVIDSFTRFRESREALQPLLKTAKRIEVLEAALIEKNALYWDGEGYKAVFRLDQAPELGAKYLHEMMEYESQLEELQKSQYGTRINQTLSKKARRYFAEKRAYSATINEASGRYLTNPLLKNRGKAASFIALALSINIALSELGNSSGGVSIFTQIQNNINANSSELGATVEWKENNILPFSGIGRQIFAGAYIVGSVAAAAYIADRTQDISFDMRESTFSKAQLRSLEGISSENVDRLLHKQKLGLLGSGIEASDDFLDQDLVTRKSVQARAKGGRFKNFTFAFFGLMVLPHVTRFLAANTLRGLQALGGITQIWGGNNLFQTSSNVVGSDFRAIADLENYRNKVLARVRSGSASNLERLAAYKMGLMSRSASIVGGSRISGSGSASNVSIFSSAGTTQVIAKQAPLPFIQFFQAETIKYRTFDSQGSVRDGGISYFNVGIQSGPIMGMTLSFGLPVAYDWRGKGGAFDTGIIYSDEKDNVFNYLEGVTNIVGSLFIARMAVGGFMSLGDLLTRKSPALNRGFVEAAETLDDTFKVVYKAANIINAAPRFAANTLLSMGLADYRNIKTLTDPSTFASFRKPSDPTSFRPSFTKVLRGAMGAAVGYHLYDFFVRDEKDKSQGMRIAASTLGFAAGYSVSPILGLAQKQLDSLVDSNVSQNFLQKFPAIRKHGNKALIVGSVFTAALFMMDSNFGISVNMDVDEEGNYDTKKQLLTASLFTATVSVPLIIGGNLGKSPEEVIESYEKVLDRSKWTPFRNTRAALLRHEIKQFDQLLKIAALTDGFKDASSEVQESLTELKKGMQEGRMLHSSANHITSEYMENSRKVLASKQYRKFISGRSPFYTRMFINAPIMYGLTALASTAVLGVIGIFNGAGGDNIIPKAYDILDRQKGGFGLVTRSVADVLRLITRRDSDGYIESFDLYSESIGVGRGSKKIMGTKLLSPVNSKNKGFMEALEAVQSEFSINPMNSFQQVAPTFGITFRAREEGTGISGYLQIQSAVQDMSTSVYSMAPAFLFAMAARGRGDLGILIRERVKGVHIKKYDSVASNLYQLTAALPSLEASKKRRFTRVSLSSMDAKIGGDRLLTLMITDRQRRMSQLSYQPLASIISRASNLREANLNTLLGSKLNLSSVLGGVNPNMTKEEKELLSSPSILKTLLVQLLNPLNKVDLITVKKGIVDPELNDRTTRNVPIGETTEWIEHTGNESGVSSPSRTSVFASIGAAKSNFEHVMNKLPFGGVLTTAFYASLAIGLTFSVVSVISSFSLGKEVDTLTSRVDAFRNLFGDLNNQGASEDMFRIEQIDKGDHKYVIRKGNNYYRLGAQGADFSMNVSNQNLEGMQRSIQKGTDDLWEKLHLMSTENTPLFDTTNAISVGKKGFIDSLSKEYKDTIEAYFDSIYKDIAPVYKELGVDIDQNEFDALKKYYLSNIDKTINQEIANNLEKGNLLKRYRGLDAVGAGQYLSKIVLNEMGSFFESLKTNLIGLVDHENHFAEVLIKETEDKLNQSRVVSPISKTPFMGQSSSINKGSTNVQIGAPSSYVPSKLPKAQAPLKWLTAAKGLISAVFTFKDFMESVDTYSSYARLAEAYEDESVTEAQRKVIALHASNTSGNALNSVIMTVGIGGIFKGLSSLGGMISISGGSIVFGSGAAAAGGGTAAAAGGVAAGTVALPILAAVAIAAALVGVVYATRKQIGEGWSALTQSQLFKGIGSAYNQTVSYMHRKGADAIMWGADTVHNLSFRTIKKSTFVSTLGGAQAALLLGLAAAPLLIAGGVIGGVTLGYLGVSMGIGAIAGAALTMIPGTTRFLGRTGEWIQDDLVANIPFGLGAMLATPLGMVYMDRKIQYGGGPIYSASVGQSLQMESKKYLTASQDPTGDRTKSLLTSPNQYGSNYESPSPWVGINNLRPRGVMDPILERELKIRAQYYNQSIIGQRIWREIIKSAANYPALIELEKDKYRNDPNANAYQKVLKRKAEIEAKTIAEGAASSDTTVQKKAVALAQQLSQQVINVADRTKKVALVSSNKIINKPLREKTSSLSHVLGFQILHETEVIVKKQGSSSVITEEPSNDNDMYYALTAGRISHLPSYMST